MNQSVLIKISVYPHIRKYLASHYPEPLSVSERGYASTLIREMLEKPDKVDPSKIIKREKLDFGSFYMIMVGKFSVMKHGCHLTNDSIISFNNSIDDLIKEEMYRFIQSRKNDEGYQIEESIRQFILFYEFSEDELPFSNLKRWYFRERKRIKERRFPVTNANLPQLILSFL